MSVRIQVIGIILGLSALSGCGLFSSNSIESVSEKKDIIVQVIGRSFRAEFNSPYIFKLTFESETRMKFIQIDDNGEEIADNIVRSVDITRIQIRPNVYMVYWSEPFHNNTTVTHVQDFENGQVWTNITSPGVPFINMNGTLTPVEN